MHNEVILVGNMATEAELRFTQSGIPVSSFRIACDNPKGPGKEPTAEFFDVVLWRGDAQFAANYLDKGRLVFVRGYLKNREYQDSEGIKRRVTEVHAEKFKALDRPKNGGPSGTHAVGGPDAGELPAGDPDGELPEPLVDEDITETFAG